MHGCATCRRCAHRRRQRHTAHGRGARPRTSVAPAPDSRRDLLATGRAGNRTSAAIARGGAAALEYYKTLPADGYTILTFTVGHAAVVAKGQGGMTIDDLRPIARGTDDPQILMTKCGTYSSAEDFVAQQKEAGITYGVTHLGNIMMFRHSCLPKRAA